MTDENEHEEFHLPEGFWSDIDPSDFARESSARHVAVMEIESFDEFVERNLEALRFAYHAADGNPNPVAILVGPDGRRIYVPDDDETLGQYLDRLTREARKYSATRLFTAWLTEGGTYTDNGDQHTIGSGDDIKALEAAGQMQIVLYWYAQYGKAIRHGIMPINSGDTGDVVDADPDHAAPVYRQILGG